MPNYVLWSLALVGLVLSALLFYIELPNGESLPKKAAVAIVAAALSILGAITAVMWLLS